MGRIGSGKTTVAQILEKNIKNSRIIDVDSLAKDIYESDENILKNVRSVFGQEVFDEEGLSYSALAKKVFSDSAELKKLNRLMFPLIRSEVRNKIKESKNTDFLIIDAAVLFSSKLDVLCDYIIWVNASKKVRAKNLLNKGIPQKEAEMKIKGQKIRICRGLVDYIIDNDGGKAKLVKECFRVLEDIAGRFGGHDGKQV